LERYRQQYALEHGNNDNDDFEGGEDEIDSGCGVLNKLEKMYMIGESHMTGIIIQHVRSNPISIQQLLSKNCLRSSMPIHVCHRACSDRSKGLPTA